jgi:microcompartment protein CcmL/EutN
MDGYALGLIETRGKLAAVEAADVALKSANVALCGVENATGALITVKVIGDVGAVRAAVDAAKAKASLVGEVIATHVLPRPAAGITPMVRAPAPVSPESAPQNMDSGDRTTIQPPIDVSIHSRLHPPTDSVPADRKRVESPPPEGKGRQNGRPGLAGRHEEIFLKGAVSAHKGISDEKRGQESEPARESLSDPEKRSLDAPAPLSPEENTEVGDTLEKNETVAATDATRAATCDICKDPACPRKNGEPLHRCIHHKKKRTK